MAVDILKIKPGDKVALIPLEVKEISSSGAYVHVWLSDNASFPLSPYQIYEHYSKPREIQKGDSVQMISDNVARDALLRYLDFSAELSDVINKYEDLGFSILIQTMSSKVHEISAISCLPTRASA